MYEEYSVNYPDQVGPVIQVKWGAPDMTFKLNVCELPDDGFVLDVYQDGTPHYAPDDSSEEVSQVCDPNEAMYGFFIDMC